MFTFLHKKVSLESSANCGKVNIDRFFCSPLLLGADGQSTFKLTEGCQWRGVSANFVPENYVF